MLNEGVYPPTRVLQQSIQPDGIVVETKQFRGYMLYLNGWFMWWGEMYVMSGKSLGAGLTRITSVKKYA